MTRPQDNPLPIHEPLSPAGSAEGRARLSRTSYSAPGERTLPAEERLARAPFRRREDAPLSGYQQVKALLQSRLLNEMEASGLLDADEQSVREHVQRFVARMLETEDLALNSTERRTLAEDLSQEVLGVGPLAPLLADPAVTDILVNRHDRVYVERFGRLEKTAIRFRDSNHLLRIIQRIASGVGRRVDEMSPMVDARLPDGSRVNATIPPVSIDGPMLSIRRFGRLRLRLSDLVRLGTLSEEMADFLRRAVQARCNLVVSGGAGVGKSTFISALSEGIGSTERIITIEDAAELILEQENIVRLETRSGTAEGVGRITTRDLLINSLRMRPDRIIVGEVRAGEALDMLQAMNTGHEGSMTTIHANSPADALSRMETMVLMAGIDLPARAIREQMAAALHLVIHLRRHEDGIRRVEAISELSGLADGNFLLHDLFSFEHAGMRDGRVRGEFRPVSAPRRLDPRTARPSVRSASSATEQGT